VNESTAHPAHPSTEDQDQVHPHACYEGVAPTFVENGGRHPRVPHSPPGCYQSTSPLRRKRPFAAYTKVVRALQSVTISLRRACLYPPLQGGPAFLLPSPRPDALSPPPPCLLWRAHNTRRYGDPSSGAPGPIGAGLTGPDFLFGNCFVYFVYLVPYCKHRGAERRRHGRCC
jgi:hypothetical protein